MKSAELTRADSGRENSSPELIDTINQVFALFEINYHNQFYSAFSHNPDQLNEVKRLWLSSLQSYPNEVILKAAKSLIETSEYLPTLHKMRESCNRLADDSIPDAHSAYIEACRAPSPKSGHSWSHPIVYHAGQASDWYFLSSTRESIAYPIFRNNYEQLMEQVRTGKELELPALLEKRASTDEEQLDKASAKEKIKEVRDQLGVKKTG